MNAIPMVARCMTYSEPSYPISFQEIPAAKQSDLEWLRQKTFEPAVPEEPMGDPEAK